MSSKFEYKETLKYLQKLGVIKDDFDMFLKEFLLEQAQRVVKNAKLRTPVDTGALRNSWSIGTQQISLKGTGELSGSGHEKVTIDTDNSDIADIRVVNNVMEVEIYNPMEYASYVEYGHHAYEGRYMLTISINEVRQALPARFKSAFDNFLKKKGF